MGNNLLPNNPTLHDIKDLLRGINQNITGFQISISTSNESININSITTNVIDNI